MSSLDEQERRNAIDIAKNQAERKAERAREVARRTKIIRYWQQRDPTQIPILTEQWKAQDKYITNARRRTQTYINLDCTICSRPFWRLRKPAWNANIHCPACTKELRLRKDRAKRTERWTPDKQAERKTYKAKYDATHKDPRWGPKPKRPPSVVWSGGAVEPEQALPDALQAQTITRSASTPKPGPTSE